MLLTGQREVLPDIRSLHDTLVPWRPNGNRALLHNGNLHLRPFHDQRWDGKDRTQATAHPQIQCDLALLTMQAVSSFMCVSSFCPFREKSASGCSKWQQRSTKTCTALQWQEKALIATSSASMWFPNTWEKTQLFSKRYDLLSWHKV